MPTAILVDGDFFLRRCRAIYGLRSPAEIAGILNTNAKLHLRSKGSVQSRRLYRIFFYDCPPLSKKAHNPISRQAIDFSRTEIYAFRSHLHLELVKLRKLALRLGYLDEKHGEWVIKPQISKELLARHMGLDNLTPEDVKYDVRQKGVDMRIGLDIAALSFKKQVDQIVLIAGDSDFVPAAKLARREGIDFILDPMWATIRNDLHEHIDGLRSTCPRPKGMG